MSNSAISLTGYAGLAKDRNKIINGSFDVWQRGVTFGFAIGNTADGKTSENMMTADRWLVMSGGAGLTVSQATVGNTLGLPGLPEYCLQFGLTAATGGMPCVMQKIEDARTLAGQTVFLTYWAKSSGITGGGTTLGTSIPLVVRLRQFLGTGGTGGGMTYSTIEVTAGTTIGTSWLKHTHRFVLNGLTGCTIGPVGKDFLSVEFRLPGGTHGVNLPTGISGDLDITGIRTGLSGASSGFSYTFSLANVQLEPGAATEFERRPLAEELDKCLRYYSKTFSGITEKPAQASTQGHIVGIGPNPVANWFFKKPMRIVPTLTLYGPYTSGSYWNAGATATGVTAATPYTSRDHIALTPSAGGGITGAFYYINASASAEI